MEIEENEISYKIRGAIFNVYNNLGPGLLESAYEVALRIELEKSTFSEQVRKRVFHSGKRCQPLDPFYSATGCETFRAAKLQK